MDNSKYRVFISAFSKNNQSSYPRTSIKMTSIRKESDTINTNTGMPHMTAKLYLDSSMKQIMKSHVGYFESIDNFFKNDGFIDIIITDISLPLKEKIQLHSLWGDNYFAAYYGIEAPTIALSGLMYNARNNNWWDEFINLYLDFLRGSELSKYKQTMCLNYYGSNNIFFSIVSFTSGINSSTQTQIPFSITGVIHDICVIVDQSISSAFINKGRPYVNIDALFPIPPPEVERTAQFKYDIYYSSDSVGSGQKSKETIEKFDAIKVTDPKKPAEQKSGSDQEGKRKDFWHLSKE